MWKLGRAFGASERRRLLCPAFVSAKDRATRGDLLSDAGAQLFKQYPSVIEPIEAASASIEAPRDLLSNSGVSQMRGLHTRVWHRFANSLATRTSPVCRIVEDGVGIAPEFPKRLKNAEMIPAKPGSPCFATPRLVRWGRIMANPRGTIYHIGKVDVAGQGQVRLESGCLPYARLGSRTTYPARFQGGSCRCERRWTARDCGTVRSTCPGHVVYWQEWLQPP